MGSQNTPSLNIQTFYGFEPHITGNNRAYHIINWRDVQTKNVANNVDMSSLRAPWQNGPHKN